MVLQVDLVSMVTSDGHRQWQQWEGRSLSMRHYNNKGNLKVNRRTNHLKQQHSNNNSLIVELLLNTLFHAVNPSGLKSFR